MSQRLIVIGGGGAGISAATTAKRVDPDLRVSLYTEFEDIAYSPCGIPFVHGKEIPRFDDLFLSTVERYVADGLEMNMETVITDVDLQRRTITARSQTVGFDRLIVCTGFRWRKPDVPGSNLDGRTRRCACRRTTRCQNAEGMKKRTIKPPAGASRVSLRDATSSARVVYRDGTTGRLVVLERDESTSRRHRAAKRSDRTLKGIFKERKGSMSRAGSFRGDSKKR